MSDVSTVGQLMAFLATQPPDRHIILSSDVEGNSYASLSAAELTLIDPEDVDSYDIEIYPSLEEVNDPNSDYDPDEDGPPEDAVEVVVLVPLN